MKETKNYGFFSVEMASKKHLTNISISDKSYDRVLIEGFLGTLTEIEMIEDSLLKINGTNGVLRIDMSNDELWKKFSVKERIE
jgi:hypothetical protein